MGGIQTVSYMKRPVSSVSATYVYPDEFVGSFEDLASCVEGRVKYGVAIETLTILDIKARLTKTQMIALRQHIPTVFVREIDLNNQRHRNIRKSFSPDVLLILT